MCVLNKFDRLTDEKRYNHSATQKGRKKILYTSADCNYNDMITWMHDTSDE